MPDQLFINEGSKLLHIFTQQEIKDAGYSSDLFTTWKHIGFGKYANGDRLLQIDGELNKASMLKGKLNKLDN